MIKKITILLASIIILLSIPTFQAISATIHAGTQVITGAGGPDSWYNILYINEGNPFNFASFGTNEGYLTEFTFWAARANGTLTPFVSEVVSPNNFIVRAIGTTRQGNGIDWNSVGMHSFAFSDGGTPLVKQGWVAGFLSSFPNGSNASSPIPFTGGGPEGYLAASVNSLVPQIYLNAAPVVTGSNGIWNNGLGRLYQFQIGAEPNAIPEPGTILLLGSGFLGLGFIGWHRKRKA